LIAGLMIALTAFHATPATAEPAHGIAMHGAPALPPGFDHFGYVNTSAKKGGMLRLSVTAAFDNLNPFTVKGVTAPGLALTYESLMARSADEPFSLYGLIAESADMAGDRSAIEFKLREQARWHDGTPITVADVLFSWDRLKREGRPNTRLYYAKVARAEQTGPRSLRFTFSPDAGGEIDREMPLIIGLMPILNKAWWEDRELTRTFLDAAPLGSGPYKVTTVDPGRRIVYTRVADYWGRDLPVRRGLYNVNEMIFTVFRDDRVALEAFLSGDIDYRKENDPGLWVEGYAGPAVEDGRIVMDEAAHRRPQPVRGFVFNTRKAPFNTPKVRHALSLMLDHDWIIRNFYHGKLVRTRSYFPNSDLAAPSALPSGDELAVLAPFRDRLPPAVFTEPPPTAFNPPDRRAAMRLALKLLAEEGWTLRQSKLTDAAGRQMRFEILLNDPKDERPALEYARSLERLGVAVDIRNVDSAQFQARLNDFDFDMTIGGWENSLSPGNEQIFYYGSAAATAKGSRNLPGVADPVVDALAAATARAESREELVATVRALDRVLLWGHYLVPLPHSPVDRAAYWNKLKRPAATPLYGPPPEAWRVEE
jgi:microcin C transport system substrate-binding protein